MKTERTLAAASKTLHWHIGARQFFAMLLFPIVICLFVLGWIFFPTLTGVATIADALQDRYLPALYENQQTVRLIYLLRSKALEIFSASSESEHQNSLDAILELSNNPLLNNTREMRETTRAAVRHVIALSDARKRANESQNTLNVVTLRMLTTAARLHLADDRPYRPELLSGRHDYNGRYPDSSLHDRLLDETKSALEFCKASGHARIVQEDCDTLQVDLQTEARAWESKNSADQEILTYWQEMDSHLSSMYIAVSSEVYQRAQDSIVGLKSAAASVMRGLAIVGLIIVGLCILIIALLHRLIITPLALASQELKRVRHGKPLRRLPTAHITELQDLVGAVPDLGGYLNELKGQTIELKQERDMLEDSSLRDSLTGIPNRRSFDRHFDENAPAASRGILFIDIDMFKKYNDMAGHQAGDACLRSVAQAMQAGLYRRNDVLYRYGGEEFAVLLEHVDVRQITAVGGRLLSAVRELGLPHPSPAAPIVTVSIGAAVGLPGETCGSLLARADKALYAAKAQGRNRICVQDGSAVATE